MIGSPAFARAPTSPLAMAILAVVVAAVVVVACLVLQGTSLSSTGSASGPDTLDGAVAASSNILASVAGGPWHLTSAVGLGYRAPWTLDANRLKTECTPISGSYANATYPAGSGNYTEGQAGVWVLSFAAPNASSGILWVVVGFGSATEIGVVAASGVCAEDSSFLGTVVDSSVAMEQVLATSNGTRYAHMFSLANATYALGPGVPPVWTIHLSACTQVVSGPGTLDSSVWALNGTIQDPPRVPSIC